MNNADLVWRLIEMLLEKEKNHKSDNVESSDKLNDQKQDEVQLNRLESIETTTFSMLSFLVKEKN